MAHQRHLFSWDVVTESSGDLLNVHVVLILEFDHAYNTVHGRIEYKL